MFSYWVLFLTYLNLFGIKIFVVVVVCFGFVLLLVLCFEHNFSSRLFLHNAVLSTNMKFFICPEYLFLLDLIFIFCWAGCWTREPTVCLFSKVLL
jgi:hypothetical protein